MLLKSLELQGFKTFPDKTTLKFENGITAVVGPNGSGKSNISDAMRWVLGEQSTRALRCSKMEDIIFSGTPQRKAQGFCEVTVTMDNTDRELNYDGDTVSVTRRFYRSGESEYRINKTLVRLRDVHELFMDTGLGRDGYSIIGQGKIDSIVSAKSEDRREIFEEAAGISRFRYRKEEAERRLEKAEENLIRLHDILNELEERVGPLREQAEKAEKFIALDSEKKELEVGLWLETLERSGKIVREVEEKIASAQNSYEEVESELNVLSAQIEQNFTETNGCTAQMEEARLKASEADELATRKEGEVSVLENDILHEQQTIRRLNGEIESAALTGQTLEADIQEKEQAVKAKEAEAAQNHADFVAFTAQLEELRAGTDSTTREIDAVSAELVSLNAALSEMRVQQSSAESSMQEIRARAETVDAAITESEERLAALHTECEELDAMLHDTAEYIQNTENTVQGHEMRVQQRRKRAEAVKAEADRQMLDAKEKERRAGLLEDLERNLEGFTQSVKTVMRESTRGNLRGIHGPVTRLLKVPREYAVALETALGAAMQNVVVDSEDAAKAAIRLLKQRDSGRATFLPLTTVRGTVIDARDVQNMPGFVGVASTLCHCDEQYAGIRDSLLGRTIVTEDLDRAAEIARRIRFRYRVVSLDGQIVNAGGSFTGGSAARNSGLLSRSAEIARIRADAQMLAQAANETLERHKTTQQEVLQAMVELENAKAVLAQHREDEIRFKTEAARAARDVETETANLASLRDEKESAAKRLSGFVQTADSAQQKTEETEDKIQAARSKMESMIGDREDAMHRCDETLQHLQEIRFAGLAIEKDKESLENAVQTLKAQQSERAARIESLNQELAESFEKIKAREADIENRKIESANLRETAKEKRQTVSAIAAKRTVLEQQTSELRQKEREASSRRETIGLELARLRERRENQSGEYDAILKKLWEEYELTRREAEEMNITIEDVPTAQRRLSELKNSIKALGSVNVAAVVEYKEVSERYNFLKTQTDDVQRSRAELLKLIDNLTKQMQTQFAERFSVINQNFSRIFQELFGGGSAELCFTDSGDVLHSGIDIRVHPPGKIVSHIELLSGGEKALVAISLYFAIMRVNPPSFCMLDEIEAALDDVNVVRFANYLRRMNQKTQFIVITHRRGTMEEADMLYGVTMQDQGISKLLALHAHEAQEKLGITT